MVFSALLPRGLRVSALNHAGRKEPAAGAVALRGGRDVVESALLLHVEGAFTIRLNSKDGGG